MLSQGLKNILIKSILVSFWVGLIAIFLWGSLFIGWHSDREINMLAWVGIIDPQLFKQFEKESGIKVKVSYIDSNEELFVKLFTTQGKGYDLILPSDYEVQKLQNNDLLKKIDKDSLKDVFDTIDPRFLHQYYDSEQAYSVPYYWSIYGIGYNKRFFNDPQPSWRLLYDPALLSSKVGMLNVAREAILITAQYLFGSIDGLTQKHIALIQTALQLQKPYVEAYIDADIRAVYLLVSGTCHTTIVASPYMLKLMHQYDSFGFLVPKEGSFKVVDNFAIPRGSTKEALVYQLINFLYKPTNIKQNYNQYAFLPVTRDLKNIMIDDGVDQSFIEAHFSNVIRLDFFRNVIEENKANQVWLALKT